MSAIPNRREYPLRQHVLAMLPLLLMTVSVFLFLKNEEMVESYFETLRARHPVFTEAVEDFTDYGNILYYVLYVGLAGYAVTRRRAETLNAVAGYLVGLVVTLLLVDVLKFAVGRPRPPTDSGFLPFSLESANQSFPSAHVSETVMTVLPFAQRFGNVGLPLCLGLSPALMGLSRLYLGEHHPSDFLGSVLIASVGAYIAWRVSAFRGVSRLCARFIKAFHRVTLSARG